jgi:DNA-directed RNA polymerase subunit RPC12/RpoP
MKVQMILMDAGALEVVLRCAKCQARVTVKPPDWKDGDLYACPNCGAPWAHHDRTAIATRALSALHDLVRADAAQLPFEVQFGACQVVREAA